MVGKGDVTFLCQLRGEEVTETPQSALDQWDELQVVLQKYKSMEEEPRGPPPLWTTDHHILL